MDVCKDPYYRELRYLRDGWAGLAQHDEMCESVEADKNTRDRILRGDAEERRRRKSAELAWESLSEPEEDSVPEESLTESVLESVMDQTVHILAQTASAPLTAWLTEWGPINKLGLMKGAAVYGLADLAGLPDYLRDIEQKGWNALGLHPEQADDIIYGAYENFKDWLRGGK